MTETIPLSFQGVVLSETSVTALSRALLRVGSGQEDLYDVLSRCRFDGTGSGVAQSTSDGPAVIVVHRRDDGYGYDESIEAAAARLDELSRARPVRVLSPSEVGGEGGASIAELEERLSRSTENVVEAMREQVADAKADRDAVRADASKSIERAEAEVRKWRDRHQASCRWLRAYHHALVVVTQTLREGGRDGYVKVTARPRPNRGWGLRKFNVAERLVASGSGHTLFTACADLLEYDAGYELASDANAASIDADTEGVVRIRGTEGA